jgi:signal transduction histidine kinase
VSDLNDYVILQVQPDPSEEPSADRQGGRTDIDQFIYRASHDLRGPLATMRGLVNLLKLRKDETEIDRLIELIDIHAQKLDDRLFQLFYFSSAQAPVASNGDVVSASQLDGHLRETVSVHGGDRQVTLHPVICRGLNPHLPAQPLTSILDNIVLYLLGASSAQIWVEIEGEVSKLRLTLMGEGSITPAKIRRAIRQPSFVYQDLLAYPLLMNYYAAQKSIQYVRGHLTTTFLADDRQRIDITIPRELDANE